MSAITRGIVAAVLLAQIGIDDGFDLTAGRRFRDCSCHPRSHLLKAVGQRLDDKIILALEVTIETAMRHLQRVLDQLTLRLFNANADQIPNPRPGRFTGRPNVIRKAVHSQLAGRGEDHHILNCRPQLPHIPPPGPSH